MTLPLHARGAAPHAGDAAAPHPLDDAPHAARPRASCGATATSGSRSPCATSSCATARPRSASRGSCCCRCSRAGSSPSSSASIASLPSDGSPYFLFVFAGYLGWNAFQNTLQRCGISLIGNTALVTKVYFPRIILPAASVLASLLDFADRRRDAAARAARARRAAGARVARARAAVHAARCSCSPRGSGSSRRRCRCGSATCSTCCPF